MSFFSISQYAEIYIFFTEVIMLHVLFVCRAWRAVRTHKQSALLSVASGDAESYKYIRW